MSVFRDGGRRAAAVIVAAALLFVTACAAEGDPAAGPGSASSSPAATETSVPIDTPMPSAADYPDGIVPNGPSTIGADPYIRSTIADDDTAMQYDPSLAPSDVKAAFTEDQLSDALQFVVRFLAENYVDTPLINSAADDGKAWFEQNKGVLNPKGHDDYLMRLSTPAGARSVPGPADGPVIPALNFMDGDAVLEVVYSQDEPRVTERNINLNDIILSTSGDAILFYFDLESRMQATEANGDRPFWLYTTGPAELVVIANPDGGWYIADYKYDLHGVTQKK